jgi:ABC-2 type transport system permease protein
MSNVLTIARRELATMFRSALAYVFLILMVFAAQFFHATTVFAMGQADLRVFFDTLPWVIAVFSALITMRSWAEERQDNTYEMLLTFPMRVRDLVLGKWLAALAFMVVAISGTFMVAVSVFSLGHPDPGPVWAGYTGSLLFAATCTAAGVFFSSITRSQLLAALLSIVVGVLTLLFGTALFASLWDWLGGIGSLLRSTVSPLEHYGVFARGVIEVLDIAYFAAWTVIFLHLNALFVALRRVADSWPRMIAAAVLGIGCGAFASRLVSEGSAARLDLTEDKLYTLSPATLAILGEAQVPVQVRYYVSRRDDMTTDVKSLERDVTDRLNEIAVASHGKLQFSVIHLNVENLVVRPGEQEDLEDEQGEPLSLDPDAKKEPKDEKKAAEAKKRGEEKAKSVERRLLEKGVEPFTAAKREATQVTSKLVYSTIGVAYREKDEEFITPVRPENLQQLEYRLANVIAKMTRARPAKVAVVTGEDPMDPQMRVMYERMGQKIPDPYPHIDDLLRAEKVDVVRVKLTAQEQLPEDYDALVVVGPVRLDERQRWEIGRAIVEGKPTLLALQRWKWDYRQTRQGIVVTPEAAESGLEDLLAANGLGVSKDVLLDSNSRPLVMGGMLLNLPTHVFVTHGSMSPDSPITQRLNSLLYLWGSSLELDNAKLSGADMKRSVLLSSSDKAWLRPAPTRGLSREDIDPEGKELAARPLMVMVEGQFTDDVSGKPRPKWTPKMELGPDGRPIPAMPDGDERPARPAKGKLILAGCARMWAEPLDWQQLGNASLLLNCVDALTLDENLLRVRSKQPTDRSFEKPSEATATWWTVATLGIVPLVIVIAGVGVWFLRAQRRERWNESHGRWRS